MKWSVIPAAAIAISLAVTLAVGPLGRPAVAAAAPPDITAMEAPGPAMLGYTPVLAPAVASAAPWQARERQALRSYELAVALNYGAPFVVASLGGLALAPLYGNATASSVAAVGLGTLTIASFAAGYVYAGDPMRGALVTLGEFGVLTAAMVVGGGVAVLIAGPGQGAGFILPLVGAPIVGATWIACQVWKLRDLREVVDRTNDRLLEGRSF